MVTVYRRGDEGVRGIYPGENVYRGDWDRRVGKSRERQNCRERELEWSPRGWDEAGPEKHYSQGLGTILGQEFGQSFLL